MKPFLLITSRADDAVVRAEVESYQLLTGLSDADMVWRRAERDDLADLEPEAFSGTILAGSPFTVSVPDAAKSAVELSVERKLARLLDRIVARDAPFLGICYGVGVLGRHQGARIDSAHGEEAQVARVTLTDAGREDPLLSELPRVFDAFVGHKEAVSSLPAHVTVLAASPSCPVQAFRVGQHVYATQFHPEMDSRAMVGRIHAYSDHGYFPPTRVAELIDEVQTADVRASHLVLARFIERYARSSSVAA